MKNPSFFIMQNLVKEKYEIFNHTYAEMYVVKSLMPLTITLTYSSLTLALTYSSTEVSRNFITVVLLLKSIESTYMKYTIVYYSRTEFHRVALIIQHHKKRCRHC